MIREDSLYNQMQTVLFNANEAGCYDAADWIREKFFGDFSLSLCMEGCLCVTKTIDGKCGKCGEPKKE